MSRPLYAGIKRRICGERHLCHSLGRAVQTATLRKIADNRYRGTFYNHEYGISGTITVIVRGSTQSVSLTSDAGWASLKFSK